MPDDPVKLDPFEGQAVLLTTAKVTKLDAALSESLSIDPRVWRHGDEVCVVTRCRMVAVGHPNLSGTTGVKREQKLEAQTATVVDLALVEDVLIYQELQIDEERLRRQRAEEEAKGVQRLAGTEPWATDDDPPDPDATPDPDDEAG